jgi:hypothetical protein
LSPEGQDFSVDAEHSPVSQRGFGVVAEPLTQSQDDSGNVPPSPEVQDDFGMDGDFLSESLHGSHVGASPSSQRQCSFDFNSMPLPEEGPRSFDMAASPSPQSQDSFGFNSMPLPDVQDDFGMDTLPSPRVQDQGIRLTPPQRDSPQIQCSFGFDSSALLEAQDSFGMDAPPSPEALLLPEAQEFGTGALPVQNNKDSRADFPQPTEAEKPPAAQEEDLRMDFLPPAEAEEPTSNPLAARGESHVRQL